MVNNGKELIHELALDHYDLILMDIRMPVMDGPQTTKKIRNSLKYPVSAIPIIALTATLSSEDEIRLKTVGMDAVISKPFAENHLLQTITELLMGNPQKDEKGKSRGPSAEKQSIKEKEVPLNLEKLYKLANNDNNFVREMLEMFMRTTQQGVTEMHSKSLEKDWAGVAELAHKIISPCKHVGADKLISILKKIEELARDGQDEEQLTEFINKAQSNSIIIFEHINNQLKEINL
jgi:CheY-like chemotaxis protein/HPt (histidine-containing phosphotransfer) domain-containing protein